MLVRRPDGSLGSYEEFNPATAGQTLSLQRNDSIYIPLNTDLMTYDSVHVRGFVNHPKNFVHFEGLTVEQAILMAGGVRSTGDLGNVEVSFPERKADGAFTGTSKINRVTLNWTGTGTLLPPGATVSVRQRSNMNTSKVVYVMGAVATPGGYSLQSNGEPIGGVVKRIGDFDRDGLPQFALVVRNRGFIEELDQKNMEPRMLDDSTYVMQASKKKLRQADTVAVDLTSRWALHNFRVQDGDTLVIPRRINTVFVKGAVQNQAGLSVQPGRRAKYYLRAAGGVAPNGIRRSLVVEYANGRSATMRYFMGVVPVYPRVYSNSTITVAAEDPDARRNDPASMAAISSIIGSTSSLAMTLFFLLK